MRVICKSFFDVEKFESEQGERDFIKLSFGTIEKGQLLLETRFKDYERVPDFEHGGYSIEKLKMIKQVNIAFNPIC